MTWFFNLVLTLTLLFVIFVLYLKLKFSFWKNLQVPYIRPSYPLGSLPNPLTMKKNLGAEIINCYNKMKSKGHKYFGMYLFTTPVFVPVDPEIIKNILVKDFNYFQDRGVYVNEIKEPLSAHLFSLSGYKWKHTRARFTPIFTSLKMKYIFEIMQKCTFPLESILKDAAINGNDLNLKQLNSYFITDVIGSTMLGIECNSFTEQGSEFVKYSRKTFDLNVLNLIRVTMYKVMPGVASSLNVPLLTSDVTQFFLTSVRDLIDYREKHKIVRNDLMQLIIELYKERDENVCSFEEIAAQVFGFFVAAFETSTSLLTHAFYSLAKNQDIQEKLRADINDVLELHDGNVSYACVQEMTYLDNVLKESLRMYPSLPILRRRCVKDYPVPNTNVIIKKNVRVLISLSALQNDPEYYSEPDKFNPDRFSFNNKNEIPLSTYLPFGCGPRFCIGNRFAMQQMKICIIAILKNYKLLPGSNFPDKIVFHPAGTTLSHKEEIYFRIVNIDK